jgi:hypothetical protein
MHETAAFVKKTVAVFIDHDPVGVDKYYWRRILAACINWFGVHATPIARKIGAELHGHAYAVTRIEMGSGRN